MMILVFHLNITNKISRTRNHDKENNKIWVPLKYVRDFWRTVEVPLINCEINLISTLSKDCILISGGIDDQVPKYATKHYVPVVTLSTPKNVKLLNQ